MELEAQCSICLLSYTSTSVHRMTSLKCGHCFGYSCIERWVKMNKRAVCPACSKPCKLGHLREIYAVGNAGPSHANEEDLIEKYLNEAKRVQMLEEEIAQLRQKLDLLQLGARQTESWKEINNLKLMTAEVHFIRTDIALEDSLVELDTPNGLVLVTYVKQGVPGFYKYKYACAARGGEFIPFGQRISDMKTAPRCEGLVLVASGNEVFLMNLWNNRIVYKNEFERTICAVCFHPELQNIIYAGDDAGHVHCLNVLVSGQKSIKALPRRVHSLCSTRHCLYAASVFEVARLELDSLQLSKDQIFSQAMEGSICVQATANSEEALFVFRDKEMMISCMFIDVDMEHVFYPRVRQDKRCSNRILCGCAYVLDSVNNSINVINVKTFNIVHAYRFTEKIVNFAAAETGFVVLTKKGIHWYGMSEERGR